jgi:hypothetical protein
MRVPSRDATQRTLRSAKCPVRVKVRRTQYEYVSSASHLSSDIARRSRHFAFMSEADGAHTSREESHRPVHIPSLFRRASNLIKRAGQMDSPSASHTIAVLIVSSASGRSGRMINAALVLLILVLGVVAPAKAAAELDDAVAAAHRGDYAAALRRLSPLAEKGDARVQFDVGFMHASGWGGQHNPSEAITWYREATDQGLQVAQHFLGIAKVPTGGHFT